MRHLSDMWDPSKKGLSPRQIRIMKQEQEEQRKQRELERLHSPPKRETD